VRVNAKGLQGGKISISGAVSSQYLTALLMAAPLSRSPEVRPPLLGLLRFFWDLFTVLLCARRRLVCSECLVRHHPPARLRPAHCAHQR
jgi:hypothetical protein